jgi:hypothetical protein
MNSDESGRSGTERGRDFSGWWPKTSGMTRRFVAIAVLLVAVAGRAVVAADAGGQPDATAGTPAAMESAANGEHGPVEDHLGAGEQLVGLVAAENRDLQGSVDRNAFGARLDAADSPAERAALVDRRLSDADERLAELEGILDGLEANDGDDNGRTPTARAAEAGATAGAIQELLADIEAVTRRLPAAEREQRNLSERLTALTARTATVRERTREARRLVRGADSETRAAPITLADVEKAIQGAVDDADAASQLLGSESIDLRIRRANGSTLRLAVETDGGEITEIWRGSHDDPTVQVYTDYGVVRTLQRTDDVRGAIEDALAEDRIVYDGAGLYHSMRFGTADLLDRLTG